MDDCRKRRVEVRGDETVHRCINKKAQQYKNPVDAAACSVCPMRVFIEKKQKQKSTDLPIVETGNMPQCEFRMNGGCSVTGLKVDADICNRCAKDSKMETARMGEKVVNFATAIRKWVAAGRPERTDEQVVAILEDHCKKCNMYNHERQVCNSCGCPANRNLPAIRNKLKMATEQCPLGRFGTDV
jgi:ribosomal protein L37E